MSASATKYAQRTTCSVRVGPLGAVGLHRRRRLHAHAERPHARDDVRVGRERVPAHGVRARRQRRARGATTSVPAHARRAGVVPARVVEHLHGRQVDELVEVEADRPSATARAAAGTRARCRRATRAPRPPPARRARRRGRRARAVSPVRLPGERREVPEDRRDVAVAVEHHGERDHHDREPGLEHGRARPEDGPSGTSAPARASSRSGGAGTPSARTTSRSARARGTRRRTPRARPAS